MFQVNDLVRYSNTGNTYRVVALHGDKVGVYRKNKHGNDVGAYMLILVSKCELIK